MSTTITLYDLDELAKQFPTAYRKVIEKWRQHCQHDSVIPWGDEIVASYQKIAEFFECKLQIHNLGPYAHPVVSIKGVTPCTETVSDKLRSLGYPFGNDNFVFTGLCPLTGVCFDDDILEKLWQIHKISPKATPVELLASLSHYIVELMEAECEHREASEDEMCANWHPDAGIWFTAQGDLVNVKSKCS
jgi:hypothetical protein